LIIIPAVAAVFFFIGALKFIGVWSVIESSLSTMLSYLSIEPRTGIVSILAAPTLAVAQLTDLAATIDPRLIVGSFVLANSGLPLSVIFGQVPVTWAESSDLNEREVGGCDYWNDSSVNHCVRARILFNSVFGVIYDDLYDTRKENSNCQ